MKFYRIKHKPTGLYYKPGGTGNNLTKNGKVYTSGNNALHYYSEYVPIWANHKLRSLLRQYYNDISQSLAINIKIPHEDFEIEEVSLSIS